MRPLKITPMMRVLCLLLAGILLLCRAGSVHSHANVAGPVLKVVKVDNSDLLRQLVHKLEADLYVLEPPVPSLEERPDGWGSNTMAGNAIVYPGDRRFDSEDIAMALSLIKDGNKPRIEEWMYGFEWQRMLAGEKIQRQNQMADSKNFVACHDVAEQLRSIMGVPETDRAAGGGGIDRRRAAVSIAKSYFNTDSDTVTPAIISIKAKTNSGGGHSFSLIVKPNGKVDVLEAWASQHSQDNLATLLHHCKSDLSIDTVVQALDDIVSRHLATRTRGYTSLSIAYNRATLYELDRSGRHETDDNKIELYVEARELRPFGDIERDMLARLQTLEEYKYDVCLTATDIQALKRRTPFAGYTMTDEMIQGYTLCNEGGRHP